MPPIPSALSRFPFTLATENNLRQAKYYILCRSGSVCRPPPTLCFATALIRGPQPLYGQPGELWQATDWLRPAPDPTFEDSSSHAAPVPCLRSQGGTELNTYPPSPSSMAADQANTELKSIQFR